MNAVLLHSDHRRVSATDEAIFRVAGARIQYIYISGVPRNFVRGMGGFQQIQLRTEDKENGDLGAVAP